MISLWNDFVNIVGLETVNLLIAIPVLGIANIIGGALLGELEGGFSFKILMAGVVKFIGLYALIGLIVIAGALADMQLFVVMGDPITIIEVLNLGVFGAVGLYAYKAIVKLLEILQVEIDISRHQKIKDIEEDLEDIEEELLEIERNENYE